MKLNIIGDMPRQGLLQKKKDIHLFYILTTVRNYCEKHITSLVYNINRISVPGILASI